MQRLICRPYLSQSSLKELFERCAEDFGGRTAIVHGAEALTYRDLNRLANGMAGDLRQRGGRNPAAAHSFAMPARPVNYRD